MNAMKAAYVRGAKAGGKEDEDQGAEKDLMRVEIEESDNEGFIITCHYQAAPAKGKGGDMPMTECCEEKKKVFSDWDGASAFLDDLFSD